MHIEVDRLPIAGGAHRKVDRSVVFVLAGHYKSFAAHRGIQGTGIRIADDAVNDVLIRVIRVSSNTIKVDLNGLRVLVEDHILHRIDDIRW